MTGFYEVDIDTENITLEESIQILDMADIRYRIKKTYSTAVNRLLTYTKVVTHTCCLITRLIDIFLDDWNTQQIILENEGLAETFKDKIIEIEDKFEGVSEVLEKIEQIKHIFQEIEHDGVYENDSSIGCERQLSELDEMSDFSWTDSDDDI